MSQPRKNAVAPTTKLGKLLWPTIESACGALGISKRELCARAGLATDAALRNLVTMGTAKMTITTLDRVLEAGEIDSEAREEILSLYFEQALRESKVGIGGGLVLELLYSKCESDDEYRRAIKTVVRKMLEGE